MDKDFFNALEEAYYAQEGMPQAPAAFGKLWQVVQGLWAQGVNPIVIINMIQWIMEQIATWNTSTVQEIIARILAFLKFGG